jgi:probable HAF family extracellular repeat protein
MPRASSFHFLPLLLQTFFFVSIGFAQTTYTITDLGTLGGTQSVGQAINNSGQITGFSDTVGNSTFHAFVIFPPYTAMIDLGTLGGNQSAAYGINASGQVTGYSFTATSGVFHAFVTSPPYTAMTEVGTLGGAWSGANGINDAGQITGYSAISSDGTFHAFVASPPYSTMIDLGTLGGTFSGSFAINNSGQVTGWAYRTNGNTEHAIVISPPYTAMIDLGTLGGSESVGQAINNSGQIAGYYIIPVGNNCLNPPPATDCLKGILIPPPYTALTDLGTLGGGAYFSDFSVANGINTSGQIVGSSYINPTTGEDGFLYSNGSMVGLSTLIPSGSGWKIESAAAINDVGQITGVGYNPNGVQHAYLLSPVNTPAGSNEVVQPLDTTTGGSQVALSFSTVTQGGFTGLTTSTSGPTPPAGFSLGSPPVYYSLTTTASFTGPITICINYAGITFSSAPQLFHFENNSWVNVTTSTNTATQIVCGSVTSLSPFALFSRPYTAQVQQPINSDGSSVFSATKGVVPVKFTLALNGTATCNLPTATIAVTRTAGGTVGAIDESLYDMASDSGSTFRISSCQYVYNLGAKSLGPGTYRVDIRINTNTVGNAVFALK